MIRLLLLLSVLSVGAETNKIRCIQKAPNPVLTVSDINTVSRTESKKTSEGFTGSVAVIDCFDEMEYRYTGGRYHDEPIRFRLHTPRTTESNKTYPLLVWFHGRGESGNDNIRQLAHMQSAIGCIAGRNAKDAYILAVQCPGDNREWSINVSKEGGKGDATMIILREITDALIDEYPIDEDRISVYGLSSGGEAAWQFVADSPGKFSALAIASAAPPKGTLPVGMNVWLFCCDRDERVSLDAVREAADMLNDSEDGYAVLTVVESSKHDSWTVSLRDRKILSWLISQKRGSLLNPPPGLGVPKRSFLQAFLLFGSPILCLVALSLFTSRGRT